MKLDKKIKTETHYSKMNYDHLKKNLESYELDDVEQVDWLIGHIEILNGHINSLHSETKGLEEKINREKKYNESFLKLLRTQSCVTDIIDLINKRFESEKKDERFEW